MVPIMLATYGKSPGYAFKLSLLAATLGWLCSIWWVIDGLSKISNAPINVVLPVVFLFCVLAALPYALAFWLQAKLRLKASIYGAVLSALIFTCLINYIPHVLPGNLAHALYLQTNQIQLASIGGVALVFFVIHLVNVCLAYGLINLKQAPIISVRLMVLAACLFASNLYFGTQKTSDSLDTDEIINNEIKIAMIQPNISVENRTRDDWLVQAEHLVPLIQHVANQPDVNLIVMPEIPVPLSFQHFDEDKKMIKQALGSVPLMLTSIEPVGNEISENNGYFNTVELITGGQLQLTYYKQVLLPFGEYLPFEQYFPWLRNLFPNMPNYLTKQTSSSLPLSLENRDVNLVPLICYEAVFSDHLRDALASSGDVLINTSNDGWFSALAGNRTHLALALFRTIEFNKPMVRSTNTGISVVIDNKGRIIEESRIPSETLGFSFTSVPYNNQKSFYQKFGAFLPYLFIFITILLGFRQYRRTISN